MVCTSLPFGASSIDHTEMPTVPKESPRPNMTAAAVANQLDPISLKHRRPVPPIKSKKNSTEPFRVPMASKITPLKSFDTIKQAPLTAMRAAAASVENPSEVNRTPR